MSVMDGLDVTSPGRVIEAQNRLESQLQREADKMMANFLGAVNLAAKRANYIYPPDIYDRWKAGVRTMLRKLEPEVAAYVEDDFLDEELPGDVYNAVTSVLASARSSFATVEERNALLDKALSATQFQPEQLVASASWASEDRALVAAGGFWDASTSVWIRRVRKIVRTSATGMIGRFTVTVIRLGDFESKRWVTRHDDRVRLTHKLADGQTVPVNMPFLIGGFPLQHPGDRTGEYGEIVQCRCVLVGVGRRRG